jgi:hypothetical protein
MVYLPVFSLSYGIFSENTIGRGKKAAAYLVIYREK